MDLLASLSIPTSRARWSLHQIFLELGKAVIHPHFYQRMHCEVQMLELNCCVSFPRGREHTLFLGHVRVRVSYYEIPQVKVPFGLFIYEHFSKAGGSEFLRRLFDSVSALSKSGMLS